MKVVLKREIMEQIHEWARKGGEKDREVVGWLVGFWGKELVVQDAVLSKGSSKDNMTGATGSPTEESELSLSLPRGYGIVGLFHSHPFTKGSKALFHSKIDDLTLSERSRRGRYISIVTEGEQAKGFMFEDGKRIDERLDVVPGPAEDVLEMRSGCIKIEEEVVLERLDSLESALRGLEDRVDTVPITQEGGTNNGIINIEKRDGGYLVRMCVELSPTVYGEVLDENLLRLEARDLLDLLLWKQGPIYKIDPKRLGTVEIDLGSIRYANGDVPYKRISYPKRRFAFKAVK